MHKNHLTWLAVYCLVALMFLQLPPMVAKEDSVLNTYRALVEVDALAKQHFVQIIDDDRLVDGAIRGMMLQLDPYSGYIAPDELGEFKRRHLGDYVGVGIEVGMPSGCVTAIAAMEGGPAARAGVLAGDRILEIDGRNTEGLSALDVERLLGGEEGTEVRLTLQRPDQAATRTLTVTRAPVGLNTVRGFRLVEPQVWDFLMDPTDRIGYVRISGFRRSTAESFDAVLADLVEAGMRGLIIDLRFNPGGLVDQAVEVVDRFVDRGTIVATVTRRKAVRRYESTEHDTQTSVKLVVLVNSATASAAEIVAGALQDHKRATVVGERTFGKGSVQRLMLLTSYDAAVKLTVAYYRLPGGRFIHRSPTAREEDDWGIFPDMKIDLSADEKRAIQDSRRLLDVPGYNVLPDPHHPAQPNGMDDLRSGVEVVRDRQLNAALTYLRNQLNATASAE